MTVYYICPVNDQTPYGGVLVLYRHVDALNAAGIDARLVHGVRGFRCDWFENDTPVAYAPFEVTDDDVLALPEELGALPATFSPGIPQVSIDQNAYLSHLPAACRAGRAPWLFEPSGLARRRLLFRRQLPIPVLRVSHLDLRRAFLSYGSDEFFAPQEPKRRQIAYMPRKRPVDAHAVLSILTARGALDGWDMTSIERMPRGEVAKVMRESALFLSMSQREGFGMPPVEAMACGCYVIGYTGFGGTEYFDSRFTTAVPDGDIYAFACAVESWLPSWTPESAVSLGLEASRFVREKYSPDAERASLVGAFEHFLKKRPTPQGVRRVIRPEQTWSHRPRSKRHLAALQVKNGLIGLIRG